MVWIDHLERGLMPRMAGNAGGSELVVGVGPTVAIAVRLGRAHRVEVAELRSGKVRGVAADEQAAR